MAVLFVPREHRESEARIAATPETVGRFIKSGLSTSVESSAGLAPHISDDPSSPIAGMPILEVHHSGAVFLIKRSVSPGYAGIKNSLFEADNAMMVFGDAKVVVLGPINEMQQLSYKGVQPGGSQSCCPE